MKATAATVSRLAAVALASAAMAVLLAVPAAADHKRPAYDGYRGQPVVAVAFDWKNSGLDEDQQGYIYYVFAYYRWLSSKHVWMEETEWKNRAQADLTMEWRPDHPTCANLIEQAAFYDSRNVRIVFCGKGQGEVPHTLIHELGHYFGWKHSGRCVDPNHRDPNQRDEGRICEYNNSADFMSGNGGHSPVIGGAFWFYFPIGELDRAAREHMRDTYPGGGKAMFAFQSMRTTCSNLDMWHWPQTEDHCTDEYVRSLTDGPIHPLTRKLGGVPGPIRLSGEYAVTSGVYRGGTGGILVGQIAGVTLKAAIYGDRATDILYPDDTTDDSAYEPWRAAHKLKAGHPLDLDSLASEHMAGILPTYELFPGTWQYRLVSRPDPTEHTATGQLGTRADGTPITGADLTAKALLWEADLADADLRGATLGLSFVAESDLSGADLRGADLRGATLTNAGLRDADLRGADLRFAHLLGADLRGADLRGADLRHANLWYGGPTPTWNPYTGEPRPEPPHRPADLRGAQLTGTLLTGAWLPNSALPQLNPLRDYDLTGVQFEDGADLSQHDLVGARLADAILYTADLGDSPNLRDADLRGAGLPRYLQNADLRGADMRGVNLFNKDLSGADMRNANLQGADLKRTRLEGADMRNANLRNADLSGQYLRETNLEGADLTGANLEGASLRPDQIPANT